MYWANPGGGNGFLAGEGTACLSESEWVVALAGIGFSTNLAGVMTCGVRKGGRIENL